MRNVGEKTDIVLKLTSIVEKMYPNCNQTKSQTYKFDFIQFQKLSQLTKEFDDWYDKKISHNYFYTQKNLTADKEITVHIYKPPMLI